MKMMLEAKKYTASELDSNSLYTIFDGLSDAYYANDNLDSSLYYSRLSLQLAQNFRKVPNCLKKLSRIYLSLNKLDSAQYYAEKMLRIQKANGLYIDAEQYLQLGKIALGSGKDKLASYYYHLTEKNLSKLTLPSKKEVYRSLYEYYDTHHQYEPAFAYLKKYQYVADSMATSKNAFESGIELVKKNEANLTTQVALLTKDKEIYSLQVSRDRQQKKIVYSSMIALILISFVSIYRYKRNKELKNKQELLNERLRISRELHDEVGGTLSGISMYSHVLKEQIKSKDVTGVDHSIDYMSKSASEMVSKLGDIIWLLNPEHDLLYCMLEKLEDYAKKMARVKGMKVIMKADPSIELIHLPVEAHKNIYLICKETISNAVKYSEAKNLVIQVTNHHSILEFIIQDNGLGFDMKGVQRGNGLDNMAKRADAIGADFMVDTQVSKGTKVQLSYNLIQ